MFILDPSPLFHATLYGGEPQFRIYFSRVAFSQDVPPVCPKVRPLIKGLCTPRVDWPLAAGACLCVRARKWGARGRRGRGDARDSRAPRTRATRARTRRSPDAHGATRVQHRQTHVRAATRMLRVAWVRQTHAELGRDSKLAQAHARPERALRVGEKITRARTLFAQAALHAHAPPGLFSREAAASLRSLTLALSHCVGVSLQGREALRVVRWRLDQTALSRRLIN